MPSASLLFAIVATAWVALVVAAPSTALGAPVAGVTYAFGSVVCHQQPDRSFHMWAAQIPVCARCFGLYVGAAIGALAALGRSTTHEEWRRASLPVSSRYARRGPRSALRLLLAAAALPTAATWMAEALDLWAPGNATRFAAALPLGAAVALTVNYVGCARPPRTGSRPHQTLT